MKQRLTLHRWLLVMTVAVWGFTLSDALFAQEVTPDTNAQLTETTQTSSNQTSSNQNPTTSNAAVDEAAEEAEKLPTLSTLALPDAKTLLKGRPVDWIILKTDEVIVVEPLEPRPGALEKQINDQLEAMRKPLPPQKNAMELEQSRRRELGTLKITLADPEDPQPEYRIDLKLIREVLYHEDLLLRRVDELLKSGETDVAYELLSEICEIAPGWRGTQERQIDLLRTEARLAFKAGNSSRARIRLLKLLELNAANRNDIADLVTLTRKEIEAGVAAGNMRLAREILQSLPSSIRQSPASESLTTLVPSSPRPTTTIPAKASHWEPWQELINWRQTTTDLPLLRKLWREQSQGNALLRIVRTNDGRKDLLELTDVRLFQQVPLVFNETKRPVSSGTSHNTIWSSPILQSWEPTDLGRQERLTLNRFAIEAGWNADRLAQWLGQSTADSSTLLSQYIDGYKVLNATELVIDLRSSPRAFEAIFSDAPPLNSTPHGLPDDQSQNQLAAWRQVEYEAASSSEPKLSGEKRSIQQVVILQRNHARPAIRSVSTSSIHWIHQTTLDSEADGVRELLRGEADFCPVIDPQDAVRFQKDSRFFTIPYATPSIITLRFSPQSRLGQCEPLRQAINLCLDRKKMAEVVAGTDGKNFVQPATQFSGQAAARSNSLLGEQLSEFDPLTAATFLQLAKGKCPEFNRPLRFERPASDVFRRCQEMLTNTLNRLGIATETVPADSGLADLRWERQVISNPIDNWINLIRPDAPQHSNTRSPWNLIHSTTKNGKSDASALAELDFSGSNFRYLAAELQRTTNPEIATRQALKLEYDLRLSAWVLPVLRITDHAVCSRKLSRLPAELSTPFDGIEQWLMNLEEESR
ncbi:extracellular solute-binding protein family 5 [Planctopirus limnophila DSM 3776]|uniref:Extracellular solute-binding protein family 5 n=1 Tax=Planctopirus limnophila (strain ATCC 43296 / DSM 3776 / IFAM 1008 / Mu 290) TaxID=521674 RepID=D5SXG3_PLAL2|nr:ABC transporter substrate-binding protein [Planctopirus limnophila]ADG67530.1 extracellular solute-binding protein family 5 [Planctopirus limnophila DSM 3776]